MSTGVDEWVASAVEAVDDAIKKHGEYHYRDKGPDKAVDIGKMVDELRELSGDEAGTQLETLAGLGENYLKLAECILNDLDFVEDDWWDKCRDACPSVEY